MNRVATTVLLAALLAVAGLRPAHAQIYVDKDASGNNDGTSWADAYTDLQDAIDNASSSSEIWVAEGVYTPDPGGTDQSKSFTITGQKNGLEVYGGFESGDAFSDRAPKENRTILSGDVDDNDTDPDGDGIIEDAGDIDGSNAHNVLVLDGGNSIGSDVGDNVTSSTVLDGLAITAGQADGGSFSDKMGGGLYCDGAGSGNKCSPTLANALFAGNTASYNGGAIYNNGGNGTSSPSITNATFTGNVAGFGGAIYNDGYNGTSSPSVTNATFTGNEAGNGGAIFNDGSDGTSTPSITNATFTGNTASGDGGAIHNDGYEGTSSPTVANTILWGNQADANGDGNGAGDEIYNDEASATLTHTIIEGGVGSNNGDGTNLNEDPQFEDPSSPAGPDGTFATRDDGVNVGDSSPALDAGDDAKVPSGISDDITGADRFQDRDGDNTATVNMGAYEVSLTPPPTADAVAPNAPYPGHPVTISGSNLSGASDVSYNGTSVAFTVVSDSEVRARVPTGATTDASFKVTTDAGTDTSPQVSLDTEPGLYGPRRALAVDGSGDYVATGAGGDDLGLAKESFSVGVWFKLNSTADDRTLVGMDGGTMNETLHLVIKDDRTARFGFYNNDLDTPSGTVTTGTWTHLTFVYDASSGDRFIYKNGEQVASDNTSSDFQGTSEVLIGRWGGDTGGDTDYFDGEIDQVRVWQGALTQAEVRERAVRTVSPPDGAFSDQVAAWRFDASASGGPAFGFTDSFRNGTFQGDAARTTVSGARLGQESTTTTGSGATVGPSDGQLSATGVNAGSGEAVQLYRFGTTNGPTRDGSDAGEDGLAGTERSNLTWGLATNGSPSADLEIDYSGVQGISDPVALIRRDGPGNAWQEPSGWTHDSGAQTFTNSGTVPEGQYAVVASAVVYVDESATGVGDGSSWADAYTDLQTAIDNATSLDEIWVAEGVYKPGSEEGDSFTITGNKDGLEVYGGFDATGSNRDERDPREHRTILSGDVDDNDDDPDGDGIIEDADDINGDNAHYVLVLDGGDSLVGSDVGDNVTSSTVLDGLVVTAGQADERFTPDGGGLYCDGEGSGNKCSPTLANALFAGNKASVDGGAIFNNGSDGGTSSPSITNVTFTGNKADDRGGAIYNNGYKGTSSPSITNATFTGNEALGDRFVSNGGGAIYNDGRDGGTSSPSITGATFTGNEASNDGGAIYNNGSDGGTSNPQVANTILWGNSASGGGDEIYNRSGASATLTHTIIEGGVGSNTDGGDNLDEDPQFEDPSSPAGADGTFATKDDGVNVGDSSPALDAGDNGKIPSGVDEDITGAARIQDRDRDGDATVNIGAYEVPLEGGPPTAQTGSASGVGGTTADLGGTVNPKGLETSVQAQIYPTSDPSAVRTLADDDNPLTGYTDQSVTVSLTGLRPDTEYRARVLATNSKGSAEGSSVTFTTNLYDDR